MQLALAPQPLQLGRHVLLAVLGRIINLTLTAAVDPIAQGRQADAEILSNRPSAAAPGQGKPNSLIPKLFRKACLGHRDPPASSEALQFFEARPRVLWPSL